MAGRMGPWECGNGAWEEPEFFTGAPSANAWQTGLFTVTGNTGKRDATEKRYRDESNGEGVLEDT